MKRFNRILASILAVLLTMPLLLTPAFAADANDPYEPLRQGVGYVALGDSFARGYGAGGRWQEQIYLNDTYGHYDCRNVDGAYPNLVAEAFGLSAPDDIRDTSAKMWSLSHDAVSTAYMLDLLGIDDGYRDEEFTYNEHYRYMAERYETDLRYFGDPKSCALDGQSAYGRTGEVMSVRELIENASLITIGLGQTDILYKAQTFGLGGLDLSNAASIPGGVANILHLLDRYFDYWKDAYPLLLDYIKESNPDAKVILVGTLNPIKDATLTDDVAIKIGAALNGIMASMNAYTRLCAYRYGYQYVDISDVETPASVTQMSIGHILSISDPIEYGLTAHPTPRGYSQIADRIIAAVKADLDGSSANSLLKIKAFFTAIIDWFRVLLFRAVVSLGSVGRS